MNTYDLLKILNLKILTLCLMAKECLLHENSLIVSHGKITIDSDVM
ncbi:hypothetical protein HYD72_00880 [Mycoplasmopsis bovis]|nr:hypothetical protein [Mycoplasmopsis bovis]QQH49239.1 hypothetical protein HYD72_00880 [Mycoplasmopsis bovis]